MSQTNEPRWIVEARKNLNVREIKGPQHCAEILQYWRDIKRGGIKDDETPRCAAFVGAMLERVGIQSTRFESARSYLTRGTELREPVRCIIVVFTRDGGGHVGFVVGQNENRDLLVLGGNQSDAVNVRAFARARVSGYRWPAGEALPGDVRLPVTTAQKSTSEA
jgi:uncharacterized protein (TIGR02594 family)